MTVAQPLPTDLPCRPMICEPRPDDRGLGGLVALAAGAERALPLREVRARASIAGGCCRTVIEQTFENTLDTPMEAVHLFPLPEDGAVTEVELVCGELVVRAECKERQEAQAVFDRARQDGHRAALLTQERDDVHTLRVTNLPPGEAVRVRIVVVENLPSVDGRWRWRFPTTVPPRYLPGDPTGHAGPGVLPDTDAAPDASRLQPPLRLAGGTRLDLEVAISGAVSHLESSLHALKLDLGGTLRVAPSGTATLDRDFVLAFSTGDDQATAARAWTDGRFTLVTVDPPVVAMPDALPRDAVFVLDISGSMGGAKLDAAKQALTGALHGLVPGDRFLLIAFDDRLEFFQQGFSDYNDRTLAQADRWIGNLSARGGTEMLPAIAAALKGEPPEGRLRTVLFITDGQAWNEDQLVAAVAGRRKRSLFFTLGIDTAVNGAMLKRLARAGGGTCELATPQDDIDGIIANLEARFGSPVAEGVRPRGFQAASLGDAELFTGRPAALLFEGSPESVVIEGRSAEGAFTLSAAPLRVDFPLGALWARRRVAALQDRLTLRPFEEEMLRPEILRVALEHRIASRFTAFVAVERSRVVEGQPVQVVQPVELPAAWDPSFKQAPGGGGPQRLRSVKRKARSIDLARSVAVPPPAAAPAPASLAAPEPMIDAMEAGAPPPAKPSMARRIGAAATPVSSLKKAEEAREDKSVSRSSLAMSASNLLHRLRGGRAPEPPRERAEPSSFAASAMDLEREEALDEAAGDGGTGEELAGQLARAQSADGSFGGDVGRTAAALLALVKLGHTRRSGDRRRTVLKAATWLAKHSGDPRAALALRALAAAEAGAPLSPDADWRALAAAGREGRILSSVI